MLQARVIQAVVVALALLGTSSAYSLGGEASSGAGKGDHQDQPFFQVETTYFQNVWAHPKGGVWFFGAGWRKQNWYSADTEKSKANIAKLWGKGGNVERYQPFLADKQGRMWFYTWSARGTTVYCRFDGKKWLEPPMLDSSMNALPRAANRGGPRYHARGIVGPKGCPIIFEDLGALIWSGERWVYGSFYDYTTYDRGKGKKKEAWPPGIYLRTTPRSVLAPDGSVYLWGTLGTTSFGTVPPGVMRIIKWDGKRAQQLSHFRGIPAQRVRHICFLPSGDAWVLVRPQHASWRAIPVFAPKDKKVTLDALPPLCLEKDKPLGFKTPKHLNAYLVLHDRGHVYVHMEGRVLRLLSTGLCREVEDQPWTRLCPVWEPRRLRVGPGDTWVLTEINGAQDKMLFHWNGTKLHAYDPGLGYHIRSLGGVGPHGRLYMQVGYGEPFVASIHPKGVKRPPVVTYREMAGRDVPLRMDDKGRMCSFDIPDCRRHRTVDTLWRPVRVYEGSEWKTIWKPKRPELPPWRYRTPRPPVNLLEKAWHSRPAGSGRKLIADNYDAVVKLLGQPQAPYYRHTVRLAGAEYIVFQDRSGLGLFNGKKWFNLAKLLELKPGSSVAGRLFMRGKGELWLEGSEDYRCLSLPPEGGGTPKLLRTVRQLPKSPWVGLEDKGIIWHVSPAGPRRMAEVPPERVTTQKRDARLRAVDRKGRTYVVTTYKGLLTVSDGKATWTTSHPALATPNGRPAFVFDSRDRVWCCSPMGLIVWDSPRKGGGSLRLLVFEPRGSQMGSDRPVFDASGNLWVHSYHTGGWRMAPGAGKIAVEPRRAEAQPAPKGM